MRSTIAKGNWIEGLVWVLLGAGMCVGGIELKFGTFQKPGAGLMPLLTGALLTLLGLIVMCSRTTDEAGRLKLNWKFFLVVAILLSYVILLEPLGFILTTFLSLFLLFEVTDPKKWIVSLVVSALIALLSYLVFSVWLLGQFPKGILGF